MREFHFLSASTGVTDERATHTSEESNKRTRNQSPLCSIIDSSVPAGKGPGKELGAWIESAERAITSGTTTTAGFASKRAFENPKTPIKVIQNNKVIHTVTVKPRLGKANRAAIAVDASRKHTIAID